MATTAIATMLLLMGTVVPSAAVQLAAHVKEDLVVHYAQDGTVSIKVPSMSTHPCDMVYVYQDPYCGYTDECYAQDHCRFAYVGNGLTTDCETASDPVPGAWIVIPGVETLGDGVYFSGFSRNGNKGAGGATSLAELQARSFTMDSGSVVGDPHVRNMAHEKFEIRAAGLHTLLQIPKTFSNEKPMLLRIDAVVEHLSDQNCNGTFIRNMTIWGNWTSEFGLMKLESGSDMTNTSMLVYDQSPEDFFSPFSSKKVSYGASYVSLKLGGTAVHIAKHYEGRYGKQKGFLNFRVTGLRTYMDVGGLMGYDNHTRAETPRPECLPDRASAANASSLVGLGRSPLPGGGGASRVWVE